MFLNKCGKSSSSPLFILPQFQKVSSVKTSEVEKKYLALAASFSLFILAVVHHIYDQVKINSVKKRARRVARFFYVRHKFV